VEPRSLFRNLQFWTLIVVILGGIFNYIFVTRLSNELTNTERQTKITLDIASFIKDIQPNLQIDAGGIKYQNTNTVNMYFDIINLGTNVVTIEEPTLYLATEPIFSTYQIKSQLHENTDFQLRNMKIGNVPSRQQVQHIFEIKFKKFAKIPDRIYYHTSFRSQTDWAVTKVAQNVLTGYLTKEEVKKLTLRTYYRWGAVEVAPKPQRSQ
jgi:hypothetical protein